MKKLFFILSLLICAQVSFSQIFVPRSSPVITSVDARLRGGMTFYLPRTHGLTLNGGLDTLGASIYEDSSRHVWVRDTVPAGGHTWSMLTKPTDIVLTGLMVAGTNVSITGSGTLASPYVINSTGGGGGGSITQLAFTNGNGFTGNFASSTGPIPNLSIGTSVNGILLGNGAGVGSLNIGAGLGLVGNTLSNTITNNNQLTNGAGYLQSIFGYLGAGSGIIISGLGTLASPYLIASSGSGSVTGAGNLPPLFTTSTPSNTITFTLTNASAHSIFGVIGNSTGAPAYYTWSSPLISSGGALSVDTLKGLNSVATWYQLTHNFDTAHVVTPGGASDIPLAYTNGSDTIWVKRYHASSDIIGVTNNDSSFTTSLTTTGVIAGPYRLMAGTVDAKGRLSAASSLEGTVNIYHDVVYGNGVYQTQAMTWHLPVRVATAGALATNTYANGTGGVGATITSNTNLALVVDGVTLAVNDRVLVKDEATQSKNGIYTVTQTGSGSTPFILTRGTFSSQGDNMASGSSVYVQDGSTNLLTNWQQITTGTITFGTTSLIYAPVGNVLGNGAAARIAYWGTGNKVYYVNGFTYDSTNSRLNIDGQILTSGINIFGNTSGGTLLAISANVNGFPRIAMTNTAAGASAAVGLTLTNDLSHNGQIYQGSSTNGFAPDGMLWRTTGTGRSYINSSGGSIGVSIGAMTGVYSSDSAFVMMQWDANGTRFKNLTQPAFDPTTQKLMIVNGSGYALNIPFSSIGIAPLSEQTLTPSSSITWDVSLGYDAACTIATTGITLSLSNRLAGRYYTFRCIQGSGGSKTITTWPSGIKWQGGTAPTLSTAAGAVDIITFYDVDGTTLYGNWGTNYQ